MHDILLVGKPNSGKTLVFNRLTGLQQKVANYPGVTVEVKSARMGEFNLVDFPGVYSLNPLTEDESVSVRKFEEALQNESVSCVVCILDGTRLERSLVLGLQAQYLAKLHHRPFIFALNMYDELEAAGVSIDAQGLAAELGSPVYTISAKTRYGLDGLKQAALNIAVAPERGLPLKSIDHVGEASKKASILYKNFGPNVEVILKSQNNVDQFLLSHFTGGLFFFLTMTLLFQSIFTWASPLMDGVEEVITWCSELILPLLPQGFVQDFAADALFGGLGSFLVFVPQIMVLTFFIGVLEDSGYLARAALICHRPLKVFGLSGKSFVPLLSGHACAIPAIYAARTIASPKRRLLTILTIPFTSCSARLPVYALLVSALIPSKAILGGFLNLQGLVFAALYMLGIVMALLVSGLLSKTVYKSISDAPFLLELPPYRLPSLKPLLLRSLSSGKKFMLKAGPIIFMVTIVVWVLGYFPHGNGHLDTSWLSELGKKIEPVFNPLGLDWRYGVAVLASFLAREVFVGTLGTLFGIEGADENIAGLAQMIQQDGLTLASGLALLVFYVLALQCVSTLAVMKQETGSRTLPVMAFILYTLIAYSFACLTYGLVHFVF